MYESARDEFGNAQSVFALLLDTTAFGVRRGHARLRKARSALACGTRVKDAPSLRLGQKAVKKPWLINHNLKLVSGDTRPANS